MTVPNGCTQKPSTVLAAGESTWMQQLKSALNGGAYQITMAPTLHEAQEITLRQSVDIVLSRITDEAIFLFKSLRKQPSAPLLVFMSQDNNPHESLSEELDTLADAVLPPLSASTKEQLQRVLALHLENRALKEQISELEREVQEQKRLSSEMEILKNAIVRNVSHELRTPLLQVKSAVALIAEDVEDKKLVVYAQNATARLESLVKNITMLGHSLDIRLGPIILRDAVLYAQRNLSRIWERRKESARIELQIEHDLPPVQADKQGLATVMQQLMDNALKFSTGSVQVIGRKQDGKIYIAVCDSGIGIPDDERQNIFNAFTQIDSSSTRPYGGAGVGLALVKLILDLHKTQIHVESELGHGSTFWFLLPSVDMEHDEAP